MCSISFVLYTQRIPFPEDITTTSTQFTNPISYLFTQLLLVGGKLPSFTVLHNLFVSIF
nr:MAG TPA: hypothetical protein [Caudoviricetes sp.]DAS82076.1 MAG TPA: hypothetical protein [Caudoviricetes sp.]